MGQVRAQVCGRKCAGAGFACRGSKICTPELVLGAWELGRGTMSACSDYCQVGQGRPGYAKVDPGKWAGRRSVVACKLISVMCKSKPVT